LSDATTAATDSLGQAAVRKRSFLSNIGLIGVIALLALIANGLLDNRLPAAWVFAIAILGTLVIAAAVTAATHRSTRGR
jgi:cobalamin synthase